MSGGNGVQEEEILACSFERWYYEFKDVTFPSKIIPLSEEVVRYFQADGIKVSEVVRPNNATDEDSDWGDGGSDSDDSNDAGEFKFPELEEEIVTAIKDLGGYVLPKLNWSAPKDARWIYGTLKCDCVQEVLTLLKASDFVAHDLFHSFDNCAPGGRTRPDVFSIVLREWRSISESSEFRCYVRGGRLLAVSQRHSSLFFPHLVDTEFTTAVVERITQFFTERVQGRFPLNRYAFDVVVGKPPRQKVRLIDFSPWGSSTDPLLFDWDELEALDMDSTELPEFRVVRSECEKRAKLENYHSLPVEVAELGARTPDDIEELCRRAEAHIRP